MWTKIVEATQEAGRKEYEVTEFESTTIPASVPFAGGDYEVKFRTKIETRATPQFEPWQYRLTVGEAVGEPVVVDEPTESVAVHIGANYSEKEVDVIFETAAASQTPVWTKVVEAKQQAGMEHVEFTDQQVRAVTVWKVEADYLTAKVREKPQLHTHWPHTAP